MTCDACISSNQVLQNPIFLHSEFHLDLHQKEYIFTVLYNTEVRIQQSDTFCQAFLLTSLLSTTYSRMGDPPSVSGDCQDSVKEVSDMPDTSNGPRGGDGLSGKRNKIQFTHFLINLFLLSICSVLIHAGCFVDDTYSL
jgi:hypothetical protein